MLKNEKASISPYSQRMCEHKTKLLVEKTNTVCLCWDVLTEIEIEIVPLKKNLLSACRLLCSLEKNHTPDAANPFRWLNRAFCYYILVVDVEIPVQLMPIDVEAHALRYVLHIHENRSTWIAPRKHWMEKFPFESCNIGSKCLHSVLWLLDAVQSFIEAMLMETKQLRMRSQINLSNKYKMKPLEMGIGSSEQWWIRINKNYRFAHVTCFVVKQNGCSQPNDVWINLNKFLVMFKCKRMKTKPHH